MMAPITAETSSEAYGQASRLYGQIYSIRRSNFHATHIGLGVWGRQERPSEAQALRIAEINRERSRWMRLAKRLSAEGR